MDDEQKRAIIAQVHELPKEARGDLLFYLIGYEAICPGFWEGLEDALELESRIEGRTHGK